MSRTKDYLMDRGLILDFPAPTPRPTRKPEPETEPAAVASTLSWVATGALVWLRKMDEGTLLPTDRAKLADYGTRLRACAAQIDALAQLPACRHCGADALADAGDRDGYRCTRCGTLNTL